LVSSSPRPLRGAGAVYQDGRASCRSWRRWTLRKKIAVTIVTAAELIQPVHSTVETDQLREAVERSLQSAGYLSAAPTAASDTA